METSQPMSPATYKLTDSDLLYYLHIPKTAGTSFNDILKSNFKPDEISYGPLIHEFFKFPPEKVARFKAISGHYFYNIDTFVHRIPIYITMLREPVERTISIYTHAQRWPHHYAYETAKSMSLHEFVTDKRMYGLYVNAQTRYLAADPQPVELAKKLSPAALKTPELWGQMESFAPNGFSDPALLERAQERLRKMAFVGLTEQFDEAVEVLCYTFGWPTPPAPKILNVSPQRLASEDVAPETLEIIRQNTQLDAALYETGKQLFEARYQQMLVVHPEKIKDTSELAAMQRQIEYQKRLIASLQQDKAVLEALIRTIRTSFGWRFVMRVHEMRENLIPQGSKLEALYLKLRGH